MNQKVIVVNDSSYGSQEFEEKNVDLSSTLTVSNYKIDGNNSLPHVNYFIINMITQLKRKYNSSSVLSRVPTLIPASVSCSVIHVNTGLAGACSFNVTNCFVFPPYNDFIP